MFFRLLCRAPTISSQPPGGTAATWAVEPPSPRCLSSSALPPSAFPLPSLHPPVRRHGDRLLAGEIRPGDRAAALGHHGRSALGDDLPAAEAGRRTEIQQVVRTLDHFAVVLDHQERVAQVAELFQGIEQAAVVAGVQADRGLVEHVEHAAQSAAHLGRQADALHLAARERGGGPGQRQVVQTHVDQELQPIANLARHLAGDFLLRARRLPVLKLFQQPAQRHPAKLVDRRRKGVRTVFRKTVLTPFSMRSRTAAASSRSRLPPQTEHSTSSTRCSNFARNAGDTRLASSKAGYKPLYWKRNDDAAKAATRRLRRSLPATRRPPRYHVKPLLPRAVEDHPAVAAAEFVEGHVDRNARGRAKSRPTWPRKHGCRGLAKAPRRPGRA